VGRIAAGARFLTLERPDASASLTVIENVCIPPAIACMALLNRLGQTRDTVPNWHSRDELGHDAYFVE